MLVIPKALLVYDKNTTLKESRKLWNLAGTFIYVPEFGKIVEFSNFVLLLYDQNTTTKK